VVVELLRIVRAMVAAVMVIGGGARCCFDARQLAGNGEQQPGGTKDQVKAPIQHFAASQTNCTKYDCITSHQNNLFIAQYPKHYRFYKHSSTSEVPTQSQVTLACLLIKCVHACMYSFNLILVSN